jgi:hypothetical protein
VLAKITIKNHAAEAATLSVLPTLWFRNTWRFTGDEAPNLFLDGGGIAVDHPAAVWLPLGGRSDGGRQPPACVVL